MTLEEIRANLLALSKLDDCAEWTPAMKETTALLGCGGCRRDLDDCRAFEANVVEEYAKGEFCCGCYKN